MIILGITVSRVECEGFWIRWALTSKTAITVRDAKVDFRNAIHSMRRLYEKEQANAEKEKEA